jgi:hypothetical protein
MRYHSERNHRAIVNSALISSRTDTALHIVGACHATTLPDYYVGVPYSFQLQASGGSGNYAWQQVSGTLPAGLVLELDGTIHGTPTESIAVALAFGVIDTDCSEINKLFYRPRVSLTGSSTTTIATILGFKEFTPSGSVPPKKYKRLEWSGTSTQAAETWGGSDCGLAKYEWSGASQMNVNGSFASYYSKKFYASCPTQIIGLDDYGSGRKPRTPWNTNHLQRLLLAVGWEQLRHLCEPSHAGWRSWEQQHQ